MASIDRVGSPPPTAETPRFTVVAAVNSGKTLQENLLSSPALSQDIELLICEGFTSISIAYNNAIAQARGDFIVCTHQDVYLPNNWFARVEKAIRQLDDAGIEWGVLGSFGSRKDAVGGLGRVYTRGLGLHGRPLLKPEPVETLDEIVLVLKRSGTVRFDSALPHFHLYGVDICMTARAEGLGSFAIPAFCIHNTNQLLTLPPEFYACYRLIKRKWMRYLPIAASCLSITRLDGALAWKRFDEALHRMLPTRRSPLLRVDNPERLLSADFWQRFEIDPFAAPDAVGVTSRQ
jgi:hypothetical protein